MYHRGSLFVCEISNLGKYLLQGNWKSMMMCAAAEALGTVLTQELV